MIGGGDRMIEKIQVDFKTAKILDVKERIWYIWKKETDCSRSAQLAIRKSWENGDLNLLISKDKYESILYNVIEMADRELADCYR